MTYHEQKNIRCEHFIHQIAQHEPNQVAKLAGMILELESPDIINLCNGTALPIPKIAEAKHVLSQPTPAIVQQYHTDEHTEEQFVTRLLWWNTVTPDNLCPHVTQPKHTSQTGP